MGISFAGPNQPIFGDSRQPTGWCLHLVGSHFHLGNRPPFGRNYGPVQDGQASSRLGQAIHRTAVGPWSSPLHHARNLLFLRLRRGPHHLACCGFPVNWLGRGSICHCHSTRTRSSETQKPGLEACQIAVVQHKLPSLYNRTQSQSSQECSYRF